MKQINLSNTMKRWLGMVMLGIVAVLPAQASSTFYYRATAHVASTGGGKVYVATSNTDNPNYVAGTSTTSGSRRSVLYSQVRFYYFAQADENWVFDHWAKDSESGTNVNNAASFNVLEDVTSTSSSNPTDFHYYAIFKQMTGLIKVASDDPSKGSVSIDNADNKEDEVVTLTAYPDVTNGIVLLGWRKDTETDFVSTENPLTLTVTSETAGTYYAVFSNPQETIYCRIQNKKSGRFLSLYGNKEATKHERTYGIWTRQDGFKFTNSLKLIDAAEAQGNPSTVFMRSSTPNGQNVAHHANLTALGVSYTTDLVKSSNYQLTFERNTDGSYHIYTSISISGETVSTYLCDEGTDWAVIKTDTKNSENEDESEWYVYLLNESSKEGAFGANTKAKFEMNGKYYTSMYTDFPYQLLDGVKAYYLPIHEDSYDEDAKTVYFKEISSPIPAHTAVILECTDVQEEAGIATQVKNRLLPITSNEEEEEESENFLKGYVSLNGEKRTNNKEKMYVLSSLNNQLGFYHSNNDKLTPFKAYLDLTNLPEEAQEAAQRAKFTFGEKTEEDTPTAINLQEQTVDENSPIYDLQGRIVKNAVKGIYIKNGKKFYVK